MLENIDFKSFNQKKYSQINKYMKKEYTLLKNEMNKLSAMIDNIIERENSDDVLMMQKDSLAKRYDVSKSQIDKFMKTNVFIEEVHYCRPSGHPLFYVKACDEALLPKRRKEV